MRAFERTQEAGLKFDYFISGLTGALLAYIAQGLRPGMLSLSPSLLEPLAIVLLCASFFFGLQRVELTLTGMANDKIILEIVEAIDEVARLESFPVTHSVSGQSFKNKTECESFIVQARGRLKGVEVDASNARGRALTSYRLRQLFLYSGFLVLILQRFSVPYEPWWKQ